MKKYGLLTIAAVACITMFSCNKRLDLQPDGRITINQIFSDYNNTRGYLNSCYGYTPAPRLSRASYTDEAHDSEDRTTGAPIINWYSGSLTSLNYSGSSADGGPWGGLYVGIGKCNTFIENMKTATVIVQSEDEKKGWLAQAHTLRALYYLQLIKRYGDVPLITVPYDIDHDYSTDTKAKFSEVVAQIIADCNTALEAPVSQIGFPWEIYDNQYGVVNRAVAYAVMSQAVTYAASPLWSDGTYTWQKALEITGESLYQCYANGYSLFNVNPGANIAQNAYANYFFTSSNDRRSVDKETIYHVGGQMAVWYEAGLPSTPQQQKAGPCPTQDLVDAYEMANGEAPILGYSDADKLVPIINPASGYDPEDPYAGRDPRFYASIYYNGATRFLDQPGGYKVETFVGGDDGIDTENAQRKNTRTGYYLRKFNNFKSNVNNQADGAIRLLRFAELWLNFAEAAYQAVGPDAPVTLHGVSVSAREAVNFVRGRAGMPDFPLGLSKEEFEQKYRNERRIEFAFEEHRFFDVRRWKVLSETDRFVTGMRITKSGADLTYNRFKFPNRNAYTDKWLMYPIDQFEVNKVIGLTGQNWQNPGWLD